MCHPGLVNPILGGGLESDLVAPWALTYQLFSKHCAKKMPKKVVQKLVSTTGGLKCVI